MNLFFTTLFVIIYLLNTINSDPLEFTCGKTYTIGDLPTKIVIINYYIFK